MVNAPVRRGQCQAQPHGLLPAVLTADSNHDEWEMPTLVTYLGNQVNSLLSIIVILSRMENQQDDKRHGDRLV